MPLSYLCRKCGRNHSKEEYIKSRFCIACGSFILPTFTKGAQPAQNSTVKQKQNNNWNPKQHQHLNQHKRHQLLIYTYYQALQA